MKPTLLTTLLSLATLPHLSLAQGNSQIFSQYAGAATLTAAFSGDSSSHQAAFFTICTNYLHGLQAVGVSPITSMRPQLEQIQVDGACQYCTSVDISRIDSCCAAGTSVACFDQFAADATPAPGTVAATATTTALLPATTAGAAAATSTKASAGNRSGPVKLVLAGPVLMALLGAAGWLL